MKKKLKERIFMNISNYIDTWSKKILKESIDEGKYDPSLEEFPQSDELRDKDYDEYEEWMKRREAEMKALSPKTANEDCCDEKEKCLSCGTGPLMEIPTGEGGDEGGDIGGGDAPAGESEGPVFESDLNEGVLDSIKNWFQDSKHWWNNISKDQKLWTNVVEQIKKSGKKGLTNFSKILINAAKNNKDDFPILIKTSEGNKFVAENPIITNFKGLKILCLAMGKDDKPNDKTFNAEKLEGLMDQEKIKKLGELSGITIVEDKSKQTNDGAGKETNTTRNSFVVEGASIDGNTIVLTLSNDGNVNNMKQNAGRAEKFAM